MRKPPYRTLIGLLGLGLMILTALWLCPEAARSGVAPSAIGALSSLGLWLAAKSAIEHSKAPSAVQLPEAK